MTNVATQSVKAPQPTGAPIMRLVNLHKRFGHLIVLDGINLDLEEGRTTVIIGESGSGKSVLLNHIVSLIKPDAGEVHFKGRRIDNLHEWELAKIRPSFGYLFQLSALFDSMTVEQNIGFPIREHTRKSREETARIVQRKLALVGLDGIQNKLPSELSGGQKKRVALARAISLDPEVILYDEPTTGLDPPRADEINELIIKLKRELAVTSVVVTHDMASVRKVADRVVMLFRGKLIFDGSAEAIEQSTDSRVSNFVRGKCGPDVLQPYTQKEEP